ncbi:hypothetical protein [Psychroflexus tropicus]|uniref:hypothetical protein n=1 Tax=Psychroflexus tropicus TaxID=197345 RepID=UPI000369DC0B|nr:hypothetical protein [Psychroflexus tropicus]
MPEFIAINDINRQVQLKPSFKVRAEKQTFYQNLKFTKQEDLQFQGVVLKQLDEHIWFSIIESEKEYFSPRLHVEIEENEDLILHCTFGPEPNVWTLFMFIHFFLGLLFIGLFIWGYSNMVLEKPNVLVYISGISVILIWIGLYVFARINRKKATPQSQRLLSALKRLLT